MRGRDRTRHLLFFLPQCLIQALFINCSPKVCQQWLLLAKFLLSLCDIVFGNVFAFDIMHLVQDEMQMSSWNSYDRECCFQHMSLNVPMWQSINEIQGESDLPEATLIFLCDMGIRKVVQDIWNTPPTLAAEQGLCELCQKPRAKVLTEYVSLRKQLGEDREGIVILQNKCRFYAVSSFNLKLLDRHTEWI